MKQLNQFYKKNTLIFSVLALSLVINFTFVKKAYSLPGWKVEDTKKWIKNHKFLSPIISIGMEGFFSEKELKDHSFISIFFDEDNNNTIYSVILSMTKRKWNIVEDIDIWNRNNKTALELIKNIYDEKISKDFRDSVNVYNGNEYILSKGSYYYREKIEDTINFDNLGKKSNYNMKDNNLIYLWAKSSFYKGKLFAYEVKKKYTNDISFIIYPLKDLNSDIDALKHNENVYKKYLKYLEIEKNKNS